FDRRFLFCELLITDFNFDELIAQCTYCSAYFAACCHHQTFKGKLFTCHNFKLVFIDGRVGAMAGIGIVMGSRERDQWSIPIDDTLDPGTEKTSQRAELLATIHGLKKMRMQHFETDTENYRNEVLNEYVVLGMTKWLPKWKTKEMRTSQGKRPVNLDIYLKLDEAISSVEKQGIDIGFWLIARELNKAGGLAKTATRVMAFYIDGH
ncbi:hypothetical protein DFS33DRAFT_1248636, partial [Desarmillaria ectypa]